MKYLLDANVISEPQRPRPEALSRGLVLATRNEDDFRRAGVKLFNPWRER